MEDTVVLHYGTKLSSNTARDVNRSDLLLVLTGIMSKQFHQRPPRVSQDALLQNHIRIQKLFTEYFMFL